MSTRHRWLAVYLAVTVALPISTSPIQAGPNESGQPVGEVGLQELIELALKNDPKLAALRLNVPVAEAEKRAVVQWRDPELRLSYQTDDNVQLESPFERSGRVTETIRGDGSRRSGTSSETISEDPNIADSASRENSSENSRQNTNSTETRTTSYTEKVIPGENFDRVIRTETESRSSTSNESLRSTSNSLTTPQDGAPSSERRTETENERRTETETFRSTSDEKHYTSRDRLARDESTQAKIRFWIPNPWEMKELVKQAAKEVDLANYEIIAAEREVILRVREDYEKLQYLYKKLRSMGSRIQIIEEHVEKEQALLASGGEFTLDQLSFEDIRIPGLKLAIDSARMELEFAKSELAASVGLSDGSRIRVTDRLLRSTIDLQATDLDYLTRMAYAHRGEIGILTHEQAIVESELDVVKSKSIPSLSFIEAGFGRDSTGGDHRNDSYGVQLGVVLPLFSWLAKDEEVVQARIESYYGSIEASKKNIANQVAEAFRSVKEAGKYRSRVDSAIASYSKQNEAKAKRLEASDDLAAKEDLRYEIASERDKSYEYLIEADRLYNQSLIRLERALGADLDQVLKVEIEPLAAVAGSDEVTAAAAASSRAAAPRAKPVPKKILLDSQKKNPSEVQASSDSPKPKGLFHRIGKPDSKAGNAGSKKPSRLKKFSNR